jgi:hypothetical protein
LGVPPDVGAVAGGGFMVVGADVVSEGAGGEIGVGFVGPRVV